MISGFIRLIVCSVVVFCVGGLFADAKSNVPKYVFLFIGDGMSVPQRMTANEFSIITGAGPLAMNTMPVTGMARTRSSNYLVTDSAAAGTAISCGVKTNNGSLGVDSSGNKLFSCAEAAKKKGLKVGIISSVMITHATPASFYAHRKARSDVKGIISDLVDSQFDFFGGGGFDITGKLCKHASDVASQKGYKVIKTKEAFQSLSKSEEKVILDLMPGPMANEIDAEYLENTTSNSQLRLVQVFDKAIELLDNDKGFFIMCEGGRIDWACHGNDAATVLYDVLALDKCIKSAIEFAKSHPGETLIVVTGDHETGGMTMGFAGSGKYLYLERLANQKMTVGLFNEEVANLFAEKKGNLDFDDVKPLISKSFGFSFLPTTQKGKLVLSQADIKLIQAAFEADIKKYRKNVEETKDYLKPLKYALGNACRTVLMQRAGVDWTSGTHTALPTMTTALGVGQDKFSGFYENSHIGIVLKSFYE